MKILMQNSMKHRGFTLVELMLGLAIFFILAVVGVPSYISFVRSGELSNTTTSLFSDLHYARSEAIKRKTKVTLCESDDVTVANPVCGTTAKTWSAGWLIFVDVGGGTGTYESASGDILLRISRPPTGNIQVKSNTNASAYIEYNTDGSLSMNNAPVVYAVCDDRDQNGTFDVATGRDVRVGPIGRPEITVGSIASCDNPT